MNFPFNQFNNFENFFEIPVPPNFCPVCFSQIIIIGRKGNLTLFKCLRNDFQGTTTLPLNQVKVISDLKPQEKTTNRPVTQENVLQVAGFLNKKEVNFEELFRNV